MVFYYLIFASLASYVSDVFLIVIGKDGRNKTSDIQCLAFLKTWYLIVPAVFFLALNNATETVDGDSIRGEIIGIHGDQLTIRDRVRHQSVISNSRNEFKIGDKVKATEEVFVYSRTVKKHRVVEDTPEDKTVIMPSPMFPFCVPVKIREKR